MEKSKDIKVIYDGKGEAVRQRSVRGGLVQLAVGRCSVRGGLVQLAVGLVDGDAGAVGVLLGNGELEHLQLLNVVWWWPALEGMELPEGVLAMLGLVGCHAMDSVFVGVICLARILSFMAAAHSLATLSLPMEKASPFTYLFPSRAATMSWYLQQTLCLSPPREQNFLLCFRRKTWRAEVIPSSFFCCHK